MKEMNQFEIEKQQAFLKENRISVRLCALRTHRERVSERLDFYQTLSSF